MDSYKVWTRMHIEDEWELTVATVDSDFSYHYVAPYPFNDDPNQPPPMNYIPKDQ